MELFGKTKQKILEPIRSTASLAVWALAIAVIALIVAVKK